MKAIYLKKLISLLFGLIQIVLMQSLELYCLPNLNSIQLMLAFLAIFLYIMLVQN